MESDGDEAQCREGAAQEVTPGRDLNWGVLW